MEKDSQIYDEMYHLASRSDLHNRAIGSIVGAFLGDAMGAVLEFDNKLTEQKIKTALKMCGGGVFELAPGQITDDSEMALSLAKGLISDPFVLNLGKIAMNYRIWYDSPPFDIGDTTRKALKGLRIDEQDPRNLEKLYLQAKTNSLKNNSNSLSNGALMRITPLAIWCHRMLDFDNIELAIKLENELTHSNETVHKANSIYVLAIRELINNNGDYGIAIKHVEELMQTKNKEKDWKEISIWFKDAHDEKYNLIPASPQNGFIRIAWTYAFSAFLNKEMDFTKGIKDVLKRGGDTDTNACICGGLIGASIGFINLPKEIVIKLLECKHMTQKRPEHLHPNKLVDLIPKLIKYAPETLFYKGVSFETKLGDYKEIYKKLETIAEESKENDRLVGCFLGSFLAETEKIGRKRVNKQEIKEGKERDSDKKICDHNYSFMMRLLRKIVFDKSSNNIIRTYEILWKKQKSSLDFLVSMIPLTVSFSFLVKNYIERIKKSLVVNVFQEKGCKEALLCFSFILGSLLDQVKPKIIMKNLTKFMEDEMKTNDDFNYLFSLLENKEIIKNNPKENDWKTSIILVFDVLEKLDQLDFTEQIEKLIEEKYLEGNLCVYGALVGAYQGFKKLPKNKVEEFLKRERIETRLHSSNLVYFFRKVSNFATKNC